MIRAMVLAVSDTVSLPDVADYELQGLNRQYNTSNPVGVTDQVTAVFSPVDYVFGFLPTEPRWGIAATRKRWGSSLTEEPRWVADTER
jgi:hypothetical protein